MMRKVLRWIGAAVLGGLLASCGGGGDAPGTVAQPQGGGTVVSGTITGFGSVIIDGVRYPEADVTTVAQDVDGRSEAAATMASVKIGQQVEAALDGDGKLTKLLVRAVARGPVESVGTEDFKVAGQTIKVVTSGDSATIFEGASGLAELATGIWVEVHGTLDADGNIVATRVEVAPAGGVIRVRAAGLVKELNGTTFKLGDLTVDFDGAVIKPDGAVIENGVPVFVYSDALPANGTLTAKVLRVARQPTLEGRTLHIGGLVTEAKIEADSKTFSVNGIRVEATNAELKGGQDPVWADVQDMKLVRVEGTLGSDADGPVLKATGVWLVPASEQRRIVLIGQVTEFLKDGDTVTFKVRGTPVDASSAEIKNGTVADIEEGTFVQVKGRIAGEVVSADEVKIDAPAKDVPFRLYGTVSEYDSTSGKFRLLGIPMQLAADARFSGGTLADFGDGDVVSVKGRFDGSLFIVSEVEFKSTATIPVVHLEGIASNVSPSSLVVNGATVAIDASTKIEGGVLANGQRVEIEAQLIAGDLLAKKIEIEMPGAMAMLRGPISDYTNRSDFKVNDQKVDASAAVLKGGTEVQLANGVEVRVKGALVAGVVQAAEVQFLR